MRQGFRQECLRRLCETLLQKENLGKHSREWPGGKTESEIKLLIQENSKPLDPIVYTDGSATKDQSGWGFTVKQGVTTIHEDRAAYTVLTSSLTMEAEAVTHALRWIASRGDSQTTHAIILTDSICLLQKVVWEARTGMCQWSHPLLIWMYCPGHAGVKGNDRADRMADKATIASGLLLGRSEVLRSLRDYLWAQSQGHHTVDRLEERGVERGSARRSSLKGRERAIVNQTNIGTVSEVTLGTLLRDGVERMWAFPSAQIQS